MQTLKSACPWLLFAFTAACTGGNTAAERHTVPPPPTDPAPAAEKQPAASTPTPPPPAPALRLGDQVAPTRYRVELTLDPRSEGFTGSVTIELNIRRATDHIWLNANTLDIGKATLSGNGGSFSLERMSTSTDDFLGLTAGKTLTPGPATVTIEYSGKAPEKAFSGLFRQEDDGNWYIYSHMEPMGARRMVPSFDEPHFKVPWQLTLHVKDGDLAFSNTPVAEEKPGPRPGWRTIRFAETKPLPSYLLALAVGPFETVDVGRIGRNKTPTRIIVPKGQTANTAYVVETTPKLLEILEDYFDMPYPYAKLDQIAIPIFGGAMENPGLITYSSQLLLAEAGKEPMSFKRSYANVGAHELAHQWFGDLVTLAWWNDVWLNESFATWMARKVVEKWQPGWKIDVYRVRQMAGTMGADSLVTARQIRQPIKSNGDIHGAFDAISYGKGGAVLDMFERWVGPEAFRNGVRAYLKKRAWGVATAEDFLAEVSAVSKPEVAAAFATFLEQPGLPLVTVKSSCDRKRKNPASVEFVQSRFLPAGAEAPKPQTWQIPVCIKYGVGKTVKEECTLLADRSATMALPTKGNRCPDWVLANSDAAGYYRVAYADGMVGSIFKRGRKQLSTAETVRLLGDMGTLVSSGKASIGEGLAFVPGLAKDRNPDLVLSAVQIAGGVNPYIIPAEFRSKYAKFIQKSFGKRARKLGWNGKKTDSAETERLRSSLVPMVANTGGDKKLVEQAVKLASEWLDTRKGIDKNMVGAVLATAVRSGDKKLYLRMRKALETTTEKVERRALIMGIASTLDPELIRDNLRYFLDGKLDLQVGAMLVGAPTQRPETAQVVYDFLKQNYTAFTKKIPALFHRYLISMASPFCDDAHYKDAKAFFEPKLKGIVGGRRTLDQTLEQIRLCNAFRSAQKGHLERFLAKY